MPLTTALPPPQIEWLGWWFSPRLNAGIDVDGLPGPNNDAAATGLVQPFAGLGGGGSPLIAGPSSGGTSSDRNVTHRHRGRVGLGWRGDLTAESFFHRFPYQIAYDAAGFVAGASQAPANIVHVFDWHFAWIDTAVGLWPDDTSGFFFLSGNTNAFAQMPNGAAPLNGFGVAFYDSLPGPNNQFAYVSWDTGGAILERVVLEQIQGAADPGAWRTVRFVLRTASSGRPAQMRLLYNGTEILARDFGPAPALIRPQADPSPGGSAGWSFGTAIGGAQGKQFVEQKAYKWGRFTPEGLAVQGQ